MTLIKSLLLGSAAGIVAVATAQAADLPTRKAAPVEYVRVCNVGGITGWTLPGSDTCLKLSGFITGQFVGGNLSTEYNYGQVGNLFTGGAPGVGATITGVPAGAAAALTALGGIDNRNTQRVLLAASPAQQNTNFYRNQTGWSTRANLSLDVASNTAWGPLIGHAEIQGDASNGLDPIQGGSVNNLFYINTAYITWAGITAGKAQSFFSFIGGGDNYANIFSPDRKGFNEPLLLAYTASFGGGFTATLSAESPGGVGASGGGTDANGGYFQTNMGPGSGSFNPSMITYGGQKWPDIVGALHVKQGWGEAQVSGVIHNVNVSANDFDGDVVGAGCGALVAVVCDGQQSKVGWALDAGVKINLQGWGGMFAPGDDFVLSGAYSQSAIIYSGINDGMWSENGQVNGNGQPMLGADAFFNPAHQPMVVAKSMVGPWAGRASLDADLLHRSRSFDLRRELEQHGRRLQRRGRGLRRRSFGQGAMSPQRLQLDCWRRSWLESGHQPQLRLRIDVSDTVQAAPSGFLGTVYNLGGTGGSVRARATGRQRQRFRWPSPHHPLLLIASRPVETAQPRSESSGVFCRPLTLWYNPA